MWFSVSEQLLVTLYSIVMGVCLGVLYDCIRLSRFTLGIGAYSSVSRKLHNLRIPFVKPDIPTRNSKGKSLYSDLIVFTGDIIYALLCAAIYSLFMFHSIRGQVRWYFIIASAIGFFVYYFTLSKLVLSLLEIIFWGIKAVLRCIIGVLLFPFILIFKIVRKLISAFVASAIVPIITNIKYRSAVRFTESSRKSLCDEIRFEC